MRNQYALQPTKTITAPNGTKIVLYTDGDKNFVMTKAIAHALGYQSFCYDNSLLAMVFKNHNFICTKKDIGRAKPVYMNDVQQVVPVLQAFIRATLVTRQANSVYINKMDDARMEAERLIEVFNTEVFGKPSTVTVKTDKNETSTKTQPAPVEPPVISEHKEEETQMEVNTTIQTNVPPVTTADLEEIGERAEVTVKIFGVSKTDALRAVTQLKAQELNRDLTPLLELLGK